jgi:aryl-alcohol dehydrogenase-like predicted oxidoreductase
MNLISKIGLGTVQFGISYGIGNTVGIIPEEEVSSLLSFAKEKGITTLDTAPVYGKSEEVLGKNNLQSFKIVSKFIFQDNDRSIKEQLTMSLNILKVPSLYGYMAHRPLEVAKDPRRWDDLRKLQETGMIKKIGFSFNEVSEAEVIFSMGITPDIIQVPFNYVDKRFLPYMIELKNRGCEIHTRSTFLQGLLLCDISHLTDFFNDVKPVISEIQKNGGHLPGLLLRYCLENPFTDKVIMGVNTMEQLIENIDNFPDARHLDPMDIQLKEEIVTPSKWPEHALTNI